MFARQPEVEAKLGTVANEMSKNIDSFCSFDLDSAQGQLCSVNVRALYCVAGWRFHL